MAEGNHEHPQEQEEDRETERDDDFSNFNNSKLLLTQPMDFFFTQT